jgi:hypothetical protein
MNFLMLLHSLLPVIVFRKWDLRKKTKRFGLMIVGRSLFGTNILFYFILFCSLQLFFPSMQESFKEDKNIILKGRKYYFGWKKYYFRGKL